MNKKRLLVIGNGCRGINALDIFAYAYFNNMYIATTFLGKDVYANSIGTIGIKGTVKLKDYDEVTFVGCSMPITQLGWNYKKLKCKIRVVNIEKPNKLVKYKFIKKDAKNYFCT